MRQLFPVLGVLILFLSRKKFVEKQEEKAVEADVTNGLWYVSGYEQNDSNITASFSGYLDRKSVV